MRLWRPWRNLPILGKGLIVITVPILGLVGTVAWSYQAERAEADAGVRLSRELRTLAATQRVLGLTVDVETGVRGYLLTGREDFLDPYRNAQQNLETSVAALETLVQDDPPSLQGVREIKPLIREREQLAATMVATRPALGSTPARETMLLVQAKTIQDALRQRVAALQDETRRRIGTGLAKTKAVRTRRIVTVAGGAVAGIGAGVLALWLFSSGVARRVRLLRHNARLLASGAPLVALPPSGDEVGQLGRELEKTAKLISDKDEQLRLAFEAASIIIWEYHPQTGELLWPESKFSVPRIELPPPTLERLVDRIEPDDREEVEEAFRSVLDKGILDVEFRADVNGALHWFTARARSVADEGSMARVVGLVTDVTTRKVAEQAVRASEAHKSAILASIVDAVLITDLEGTIVSINPAMERLLGWSCQEVAGESFDFFTMLDSQDHQIPRDERLIAKAMATGKPTATRGYEHWILCRDGRRLPWAGSAAPITDEHGNPLGWVEVLREVSFEREVDQLKSSLVSTVSHELRTPLTMIQGFSELILTRHPSPDKADEALRHINTSAQRLARLIDDLLTVSRIESGRTEVRALPVDLRKAFDDMVAQFSDRRHIETTLEPGLPPLLADPDMLDQILTNLLSNAVKYSPADTPIRLSARRVGASAEISVTDRGLGMTEAEQARLFERFFRADREEVQRVGGTGLGLYITQNLVKLQRGQLRVETQLGEGSTFSFSLPLALASQTERAS